MAERTPDSASPIGDTPADDVAREKPHADSAAGRENPAAGSVDGDEAIGNRVGADELTQNDGTEPSGT